MTVEKKRFVVLLGMIMVCNAFFDILPLWRSIIFMVGFATVFAILESEILYEETMYMSEVVRNIGLVVGTVVAIIALWGQISTVSFVFYAVGMALCVGTLALGKNKKEAIKN